jgi:hypothetical protein
MLPTMTPIAELLSFAPALVSYTRASQFIVGCAAFVSSSVPAALSERVIDYASERICTCIFTYDNRLFTTNLDDWKARIYREQTGALLELEPDFIVFAVWNRPSSSSWMNPNALRKCKPNAAKCFRVN